MNREMQFSNTPVVSEPGDEMGPPTGEISKSLIYFLLYKNHGSRITLAAIVSNRISAVHPVNRYFANVAGLETVSLVFLLLLLS